MAEDFPAKWTGDFVKKMHLNRVKNSELAIELGVTEAYISMLLNSKRTTKNAREKLEVAYQAILSKRENKN